MIDRNLQRNIMIGLTILMIIAIGIKTYQNNQEKEKFLSNGVENTNQTRKYDNPKLQSLYNEVEQELKNNHIQVFDLEVKEDENGTIGYFFQYNAINENRINEIEPQLNRILEKYRNHETVYKKVNQKNSNNEVEENPFKEILEKTFNQKYYSNDIKQEEKKEYQSKKTKDYSISEQYYNDNKYILNVSWEGKRLNILLNNYEYENIKQDILQRRYLIINNCFDVTYYKNTNYDMCYYSFVD
jgi:hypothetical protein